MRAKQHNDKFLESDLIDAFYIRYQVRTISEFFSGHEQQKENAIYAIEALKGEGLTYKEIAKRAGTTMKKVMKLEVSGW